VEVRVEVEGMLRGSRRLLMELIGISRAWGIVEFGSWSFLGLSL
jgi:hypothetical protein